MAINYGEECPVCGALSKNIQTRIEETKDDFFYYVYFGCQECGIAAPAPVNPINRGGIPDVYCSQTLQRRIINQAYINWFHRCGIWTWSIENYRAPSFDVGIYLRCREEIDEANELQKKINSKDFIRECRVCGCTDNDCSQCIDAQGYPCYWMEPDLCSRCKEEN